MKAQMLVRLLFLASAIAAAGPGYGQSAPQEWLDAGTLVEQIKTEI